jgi:hypothetical protein
MKNQQGNVRYDLNSSSFFMKAGQLVPFLELHISTATFLLSIFHAIKEKQFKEQLPLLFLCAVFIFHAVRKIHSLKPIEQLTALQR